MAELPQKEEKNTQKAVALPPQAVVIPQSLGKRKGLSILDQRPSVVEVIISLKHLSLMLKSGLALGDAVNVLAAQAATPTLQKIYKQISEDIQAGLGLAFAMRTYEEVFTSIVISVVDAGEQAGALEANLDFVADYLKRDHELRKKLKGALTYPIIVFAMTFTELIGVFFFLLPKMEELFKSFKEVPKFTQGVLSVSSFLRGNVLYIAWIIIALVLGLYVLSKVKLGKRIWDRVSLVLPIISRITKDDHIARMARTLSMLLKSGVPLAKAIKVTGDSIQNSVYQKILEEAYVTVSGGATLSTALAKYPRYFPGTFLKLLEAGEGTGTLEENLMYLYDFYSDEVLEMATNITTLLEPILIILVGGIIGMLAITIVMPVYQLTGTINN